MQPRFLEMRRALARAVLPAATAAALAFAGSAAAQDAAALLGRAADAARSINYTGTLVYQRASSDQRAPGVETARIVHVNDGGDEFEKLVSLDGPPREVIRREGEVRCYYPDVKLVRVEPRTFRNAFPSVSPQQQASLAQYYTLKKGGTTRVAGLEAQAWLFEPKDRMRYGHELWTDPTTGMLLKARMINERGEVVEQIAFLDIVLGAKLGREAAQPTWPAAPSDWQVKRARTGASSAEEAVTGWTVAKLPPGYVKVMEGRLRGRGGKGDGEGAAQLVYSDGLVAVSVFIDRRGGPQRHVGRARQGGLNQFSIKQDDYVITALGEAPPDVVEAIAMSVTRR
ncbi:MAG: MucB/RseB C-terminal domain-containing protein [Burkholderiales bacterium]